MDTFGMDAFFTVEAKRDDETRIEVLNEVLFHYDTVVTFNKGDKRARFPAMRYKDAQWVVDFRGFSNATLREYGVSEAVIKSANGSVPPGFAVIRRS